MGRPNKDDDAWNADISKVQVTPLLRNEVSQANGDRIAALAGNARYAAKTWTTGRKLLFACLALACLISVAAVVVSAVAFANSSSSSSSETPDIAPVDPGAIGNGVGGSSSNLDSVASVKIDGVGPGRRVVLQTEKAPVAAGEHAVTGEFPVGVHGEPSVSLENLCNINFGNGTCLAVFSYRTAPFGAGSDGHPSDELFVRAGSPQNAVRILHDTDGKGRNGVNLESADFGQPQVFSSGDKFGGASFSWPCGRGAALPQQGPRAVWTLHTQGGASVVEVASDNVPCPELPE